MKITLLPEQEKFLFEFDGVEQEVRFSDVLGSDAWVKSKMVQVIHKAVNEHGQRSVTILNREVFLETMKEGDEAYHKERGAWELNTTIHKLYALLDGKDLEEADREIKNISAAHDRIRGEILDWNNERAEKVFALQESLKETDSESDKTKIEKKILKLKEALPPTSVPAELKKMYFAARDESKPEITFANVTPDAVKQAYGDDLTIA